MTESAPFLVAAVSLTLRVLETGEPRAHPHDRPDDPAEWGLTGFSTWSVSKLTAYLIERQ